MQIDVPEQAIEEALAEITSRPTVFAIQDLGVWYGKSLALAGVTMDIRKNTVTAVIGPSGCGKSTFIRCLNRMSDAVPGIKVDGKIEYHGRDSTRAEDRSGRGAAAHRHGLPAAEPVPEVDLRQHRLRAPVLGMKDDLTGRVERALRKAALWDEVKDRLKESALGLSGGQQQRLCIARAIASSPKPCSSTSRARPSTRSRPRRSRT